jgi:hypothetical protein
MRPWAPPTGSARPGLTCGMDDRPSGRWGCELEHEVAMSTWQRFLGPAS